MTRTATTKLVATALAVASLGLASTAQAADQQGIAIGEPTPGQPLPAQTENQGAPAENAQPQAPAEEVEETEEIDYSSPEYFKSEEAKERFKRYCNMKGSEPSHSDKKFCEDFTKHNPQGGGNAGTAGTGTTNPTNPTNPGTESAGTEKPDYEREYPKTQPAAEKADKGSLPFTGLEIWQLGLIGIVLVGGGFGARRLLAS